MSYAALPTTATRAGDRERENTARDLGRALTEGYLSMPEYEERLQMVFSMQTTAELRDLVADLPLAKLRRADRRDVQLRAARLSVRLHLAAYVAGTVLMLGIWLAVGLGGGGWYFWPVWPIMGWGIGLASHAIPIWAHGSMRPARIA
jgi:hypothetical protein